MVYSFKPQGRNKSITVNTNNPPQGEVLGDDVPPPTGNFMEYENSTDIMEYENSTDLMEYEL